MRLRLLVGIGVVLLGCYLFLTRNESPSGGQAMDAIYRKVCDDSVARYAIAKRSGTPADACANAGIVAAAFLQAKDEAGYHQWKETERVDCGR